MNRFTSRLARIGSVALWIYAAVGIVFLPACSLFKPSPSADAAQNVRPSRSAAQARTLSADWVQTTVSDFRTGTTNRIDITSEGDGSLRLATAAHEYASTGVYTSTVRESNFSFNAVGIRWQADLASGTEVVGEIRTSADGTAFSDWKRLVTGSDADDRAEDGSSAAELVLTPSHRFVQYRLTLRTADPSVSPMLAQVVVTFIDSSRGPDLTQAQKAVGTQGGADEATIISRSAWGADESLRFKNGNEIWPPEHQQVQKFIIHHSDTRNDDPNPPATVRAIYEYHAVELGWGDIGYNFLVDAKGNIYEGRYGGENVVGGHAKQYNHGSMGITVLGDYDATGITAAAKDALVRLISRKVVRDGIDPNGNSYLADTEFANIAGHREVSSTNCPGSFLEKEVPDIRSKVFAQIPLLGLKWLAEDTPHGLSPRQTTSVKVTVSNRGRGTWLSQGDGAMKLGYHWYRADGSHVNQDQADDKPTSLPKNLTFGQSVTLDASLTAPEEPGSYTLKWDMVQNNSRWLSDQGITPLEVSVRIGQADQSPSPSPSPSPIAAPQSTWYFSEGSTMRGYETVFQLMNPGSESANTVFTFMDENGTVHRYGFTVKPTSRLTVNANDIIPRVNMATKIESDRKIYAERTMVFGHDGHTSFGASRPDNVWYFAEGSTGWGFGTWLLLMNPNSEETKAVVTFYKENGQSVAKTYRLKPTSRLNVFANQEVPNANIAAKVEADKPIVAERSMYFDGGKGGHGSMGATDGSMTWLFAEGYTGPGVYTWLLLVNPSQTPASVTVTFLKESGAPVAKTYSLAPASRLNVYVNQIVPNAAVSTKIDASIPIVAERSMYFANGRGGHNTLGATKAAKTWYLPEGYTGSGVGDWILILNPDSSKADVELTFMKSDGTTSKRSLAVAPQSRYTLYLNGMIRDAELSTKVEASRPIVVERAIYFDDSLGGTSSIGIPED